MYDAYSLNIKRVDAIRYFLLFHYGGVYMDADFACVRSLDTMPIRKQPGVATLILQRKKAIDEQAVSKRQGRDSSLAFGELGIKICSAPTGRASLSLCADAQRSSGRFRWICRHGRSSIGYTRAVPRPCEDRLAMGHTITRRARTARRRSSTVAQ